MPYAQYAMVGSLVYSNQTELLARYVFKVAESKLPPHFQKALEYKLAADFALLVTEDNSKSQIFEQKYRIAISQARTIDSQSHPQQPIISQPFTDVRRQGDTFFGTT